MKIPQLHISNRRFQIPMTKISLNVMSQISHGCDHAECAVPKYQESLMSFYHCKNYLYAKFPGFLFTLSSVCKGPIRTKFHDYNYLLIRSSLVWRKGGVGYPNQDLKYSYARFHWSNLKKYLLNISPTKVSCYFYILLISNCKLEITTVPQIEL